jgi:hypothetical protein
MQNLLRNRKVASMTAPIEPVHVMSREKYEALQVRWLQEKIQSEMLGLLLHPIKSREITVPMVQFSIPVDIEKIKAFREFS